MKSFFLYFSLLHIAIYLKRQRKFTNNIIKEANIKIYSFFKDIQKKDPKNIDNLFYCHFPRHMIFVPLIRKTKSNFIALGHKNFFSKKELKNYNLNLILDLNFNSKKINKLTFKNILLYLNFFKFIIIFRLKPLNILSILIIFLHKKSYERYTLLADKLLSTFEIKNLYNFDQFEIGRSIYKRYEIDQRPKISTILTMNYDRDVEVTEVCADNFYVRNQKLLNQYKFLKNKVSLLPFLKIENLIK